MGNCQSKTLQRAVFPGDQGTKGGAALERDGAGGRRSNGVCAFCALEEREQLKGGVYRNLQFLSPTQLRHLVNTTAQQVPLQCPFSHDVFLHPASQNQTFVERDNLPALLLCLSLRRPHSHPVFCFALLARTREEAPAPSSLSLGKST